MLRREFLLAGSAFASTLALPLRLLAESPGREWRFDRSLVLVQLSGGNDGLNTVIPYADRSYARLRPTLGVPRDQLVQLDEHTALNGNLKGLMPAWKSRDLAVVQGVGYENPNRSHFRSTDIWNTASGSSRYLTEGWIARLLSATHRPQGLVADALVLGGTTGAAHGKIRAVSIADPQRFLRQAQDMETEMRLQANPALAHLARIQGDVQETAKELKELLAKAPEVDGDFPNGAFGRQLRTAARLLNAGAKAPLIKLELPGFDTHTNQRGRHDKLIRQLGDGLQAFRAAMIASGQWDRVLVMTYSEFGRRAAENGNGGTDHGTAAPHFLLGGKVRGGLYGAPPRFDDLADGDLKFAIDYRSLYATAAENWWSLPRNSAVLGAHPALPILKA
jgi:uncharacterized protein (DUF1501 family)